MQVIYADTLFLINLIVNYLILLATAKITAQQASRLRMGLSAALGGLYAVLAVLPQWGFLNTMPIKLTAGFAMVMVVFGEKRGLARTAVIFFAVSAAFGGAVYAASLVSGVETGGSGIYLPISFKVLLVSFGLCYGALNLVFSRMGRDTGRVLVSVRLEHQGAQVVIPALVDTGNSLTDPVTGGGVLVVESEAVYPLLPREVNRLLERHLSRGPVELLEQLREQSSQTAFYLVPYTAVGVGSAFLLAFKPEGVWIDGKEKRGTAVALSPTRVSDGGRYRALVNGGML